jgi:hypothetical protein
MIAALHNPDIEQTRSEPHSGHATQFGDPCVQLRIGETDVDFAVELFDDCDRRVLWHADPIPNARLIAWHELGYGRYGRQCLGTLRSGDRQRAQCAGPDIPDRRWHGFECHLHLPPRSDR